MIHVNPNLSKKDESTQLIPTLSNYIHTTHNLSLSRTIYCTIAFCLILMFNLFLSK